MCYELLLLAERDHQVSLCRDLLHQLAVHDKTGEYQRRLQAPARLELETQPAGATVSLQRYTDERGHLRPSSPERLGDAPLAGVELEPGSYRLVFSLPDRPPVFYPVLLARGEHLRLRITLPASLPEGRYLALVDGMPVPSGYVPASLDAEGHVYATQPSITTRPMYLWQQGTSFVTSTFDMSVLGYQPRSQAGFIPQLPSDYSNW
jgi:hypothetical protein